MELEDLEKIKIENLSDDDLDKLLDIVTKKADDECYQVGIEYNIQDVLIVDKLEDKLRFLELVMAMTYDTKITYNDTLTTVRSWEVLVHNYLLEQNIVIPQFKKSNTFDKLMGGFVKEPKPGLYKWVISLDLTSLYPHLQMQYNISNETFVKRFDNFPSIDTLVSGKFDIKDYIGDNDWSVTANGCAYRKDIKGFFPTLMEKIFNDRSEYKKLMLTSKKAYEVSKSYDDKKLVSRYDNFQKAKKIYANSGYGAQANKWYRWFDFNNAEAITSSGQLTIQFIARKLNEYLNNLLKTNKKDYICASDTDSVYIVMEELVKHLNTTDELKIVDALDKFCEQKIQPFLDKVFEELKTMMNAYDQKMFMKRETIANKGIWRGKKMYILNAWDVEGVRYKEPEIKIQGIEAVRSSTPYTCRENIKKALKIIMNEEQADLQKFVADFKTKFYTLPFEEVAFPRGVNGVSEYSDRNFIYKKGTPIGVRAALMFNHLLKKHDIKHIHPIVDGDKVRFCYLKTPNPVKENVIAAADIMPKVFNVDKYIDYETQFEKAFLSPITSITDCIGWYPEPRATLEDFFSDEPASELPDVRFEEKKPFTKLTLEMFLE